MRSARHSGVWHASHRRSALLLPLLVAGLLLGPPAAGAGAATPISDCSSTAGLRAAVAAGGEYVFTCFGTITFGPSEGEIVVDKPVSIDGARLGVTIDADNDGRAGRVFRIDAQGALTLTGLSINGGDAVHGTVAVGPSGTPGVSGAAGQSGAPGTHPGAAGENGAVGFAGTSGASAPPVPDNKGGCIYVAPGAAAVLRSVSIYNCHVRGLDGGGGGPGGHGGTGGSGADGADGDEGGDGGDGGNGAAGSRAGNGGHGADAGDGLGGAIYNGGVTVLRDVQFSANTAEGGNGGWGAAGGLGGAGGGGGKGGDGGPGTCPEGGGGDGGRAGNGAPAAESGNGGNSGDGGAGRGGAVYTAGSITIDGSTFTGNQAAGGEAGFAGSGGPGLSGGPARSPGSWGYDCHLGAIGWPGLHGVTGAVGFGGGGGNGGNGGHGGDWGDAVGGAIAFERAPRVGELPANTTFGTGGNANTVQAGLLRFPDNRGVAGTGGNGGRNSVILPPPALPSENAGPQGTSGLTGTNGVAGQATDADVAASAPRPPPEDVRVLEGDTAPTRMEFRVGLDAPMAVPVRVRYRTTDDTAGSGPPHDSDFRAVDDTVEFAPGETVKTVTVTVLGDTAHEPDEKFTLALTSPDGAPVSDPDLVGIIVNDDGAPSVRLTGPDPLNRPITGATRAEFRVALSNPTEDTVTVDYATVDGTAKAGTHYTATRGTVTLQPRETSTTVPVPVLPDPKELENRDTSFTLRLSGPRSATLGTSAATATLIAKRPLQVTLKMSPAKVHVEQTEKKATPEKVSIIVTAKNAGAKPIEKVTLPKKLGVDWFKDSGGEGKVALKQTKAPADRTLGTLKAGASASRTYRLKASGDGDLDVSALVTGRRNGEEIDTRGHKEIVIDGDVLVFAAKRSLAVTSDAGGKLLRAGSPYVVSVKLENRSTYRRLLIPGIYAKLAGNASGGAARDLLPTVKSILAPAGSLDEVQAAKYLVVKPRAKRTVYVVVRTTASDARQEDEAGKSTGRGGTRSTVTFAKPEAATLAKDDTVTRVSRSSIVMAKDADEIRSSLDDSPPPKPEFSAWKAKDATSNGIRTGLLKATWGLVRGVLWDAPKLVLGGTASATAWSLGYIDEQVALYKEMQQDPDLRDQYMNLVTAKVIDAFLEAPSSIKTSAQEIYREVDRAVYGHYKRLFDEWAAGDWESALEEFATESTEGVAAVATILAPGVLARNAPLAARLAAPRAALQTRVLESAEAAVAGARALLPQATYALTEVVRPGLIYTDELMAKLYGISADQAAWLKAFAERNRVLVTLRSRAQESIAWLDKGALLKPYWIKLKNVNWTDVQYLGYAEADVGRLIVRRPSGWSEVAAKLNAEGIKPSDVAWKEVRLRWQQRFDEFGGEVKEMQKWHAKGEVKGKWPWQENGIDPTLQLDEEFPAGFRLRPSGRSGEYVVEVYNPQIADWASVTGDVDLIALTNADGTALSAERHVALLKEMRGGPVGAMHPESATWIKARKWWFKAKENYLANVNEVTGKAQCCLAQIGADGQARAVQWNKKLSEVIGRTKETYRLWWDGGYIAPPGVPAK